MSAPRPRVKVPRSVAPGEPFEIKTVISHQMESGQRKGKDGEPIPRQIINKFVVSHNGEQIMSADWFPAISANPYMEFYATVQEPGTIRFEWHDDNGEVYATESEIALS